MKCSLTGLFSVALTLSAAADEGMWLFNQPPRQPLRPTPVAPNELARFRVFNSKTWNPIALAGDLLLVRNDQEAACVRLDLAP